MKDNEGFVLPQEAVLRGSIDATKYVLGYSFGQIEDLKPYEASHCLGRYSRQSAVSLRVSGLYAIKKLECGGYLLTNREYKPLGVGGVSFSSDYFVRYEDFKTHILTGENLEEIFSQCGREVHEGVFWSFYNDANAPWYGRKETKEYLERVVKLANLLFPKEVK